MDDRSAGIVAIVTYRRPEELERALDSIETQVDCEPFDLVVVDNDPTASASEVARRFASQSQRPVTFVVEPEPGIAAARNRAVREALRRKSPWLAFIDDDEIASERWLASLRKTATAVDADIVCGPVLPVYPGPHPPEWAVRAKVFERPRHLTGTSLDAAASNNLLVDSAVLEAFADEPFPVEYGLSGGSDTYFSLAARRAGFTIVWADDAVVHEFVPAARMRRSWVLRRSYRGGNSFAIIERALVTSLVQRTRVSATRAVKGLAHVLLGCLRVARSLAQRDGAGVLIGARRAMKGMGNIAGALGSTYVEYKRDPDPHAAGT